MGGSQLILLLLKNNGIHSCQSISSQILRLSQQSLETSYKSHKKLVRSRTKTSLVTLYLLFCFSCALMLCDCFLQEDHSWTFSSNSFFLLNFSSFPWQVMIKKKKEDFLLQDEEASVKYCQAELKKLSDPLMKSISEGTFSFPGGHHRYLEARNRFKESYKLIPRKGVKVRSKGIGKEQKIGVKGSLLVLLKF